jgi:tripartite-type tricarboxylate transporter receptor subunit TctC
VKRVVAGFFALVLVGAFWGGARADSVSDFYRGKTITVVVGYTAGGGYDLYARALARHMGRHLPGNPSFVVNNMPGAGSLTAANYLYSVAPKDGSVIGTIGRGLAMEPLIGKSNVQFDARRFTWIGSGTNEISVCAVSSTSPVKTWEDVMTTPISVGGEGSGSDPDTFTILMRNLLGAKLQLVTGYPGGAEITLAIERGEVDGRCGWSLSAINATRPQWIEQKRLTMLLQMGLERSPEMPDVPAVIEKAKDQRQKDILKLVFSRQVMGRPFLGPPAIPEDRKLALRKAFDATMKDPEFLADAKKTGLEVDPVSGADIDKLLGELYNTPKETLDMARTAIIGEAQRTVPGAKH